MKIKIMKLSDLKKSEYNPRKNLSPEDKSYQDIKNSIENFGFVEPIIWNEKTGNIISGNQRVSVLLDMGVDEAEVSIVNFDEVKEKALNIALNKISGDWDDEKLNAVLSELSDSDWDIKTLGFNEKELSDLFNLAYEGMSDQNIVNREIDPESYSQEKFKHICPRCGFAFD